MKRRNVMLSGGAFIAAPAIAKFNLARADGNADPKRLSTDLMPLGGERAGSKSGLVPAWTGGANTPPPNWSPGMKDPDLFAGQKPLFTVTAENMAQYADMLSEGQQLMLKRFGNAGLYMTVYPSQRTACASQFVYDNTAANVTRAHAVPEGITIGITGAFGGVPFPILSEDPTQAGAQAVWNHVTRYGGVYLTATIAQYVVGNGTRTLTNAEEAFNYLRYYDPKLTANTFSGYFTETYVAYTAPSNAIGGKLLAAYSLQPKKLANIAFEYLVGEGRIRQAPTPQYDVPVPLFGDAVNYDEVNLFTGALDRYIWKLVGKKEMIVAYNEQTMYTTPEDVLGPQFVNPKNVRYEVHRCWVVEATLAPGARESSPFRRFYIDEDTWTIMLSDLYDDQKNYWRFGQNYMTAHPNEPVTLSSGTMFYNFQESVYVVAMPFYDMPISQGGAPPCNFAPLPLAMFDPQSLANSGGL